MPIKFREIYVLESYTSGTSWYRIWSDGWCEQGGRIYYSTQIFSTTINFLKAFIDSNYCVVSGCVKDHGTSSDRWATGMCNILNMSGTSMDLYFYLDSRDNDNTYIFWYTSGRLAINQYTIPQNYYQNLVIKYN